MIVFDGTDYSDLFEPSWASGTVEYVNCYLFADDDKLRLYEGMVDWSKPLHMLHTGRVMWEAEDNDCHGNYTITLVKGKGPVAVCGK